LHPVARTRASEASAHEYGRRRRRHRPGFVEHHLQRRLQAKLGCILERAMGIEPTTYSLGSCRSTTELRPQMPARYGFSPVRKCILQTEAAEEDSGVETAVKREPNPNPGLPPSGMASHAPFNSCPADPGVRPNRRAFGRSQLKRKPKPSPSGG